MSYQFSDMGMEEYRITNLKQRFKGDFLQICDYRNLEMMSQTVRNML